jgi:hypothetical protein
MPLLLVPREIIEEAIGEAVFVVCLLQIEVAIVALASKAPLGTLHLRHHHRHLPIPLEIIASL